MKKLKGIYIFIVNGSLVGYKTSSWALCWMRMPNWKFYLSFTSFDFTVALDSFLLWLGSYAGHLKARIGLVFSVGRSCHLKPVRFNAERSVLFQMLKRNIKAFTSVCLLGSLEHTLICELMICLDYDICAHKTIWVELKIRAERINQRPW